MFSLSWSVDRRVGHTTWELAAEQVPAETYSRTLFYLCGYLIAFRTVENLVSMYVDLDLLDL